jgi:hypothetical protein
MKALLVRNAKQRRYPHCGQESAPYTECADRRFYKRLVRILNRGAEYGFFVKTYDAGDRGPKYGLGDEHAKVGQRGFYNTHPGGGAPRGFCAFAQTYLEQTGKAMTEKAIIRAFTSYRRERAARRHLEATA